MNAPAATRRGFVAGSLCLAFNLSGAASAQDASPNLPADLARTPALDAWIKIEADGRVTLFTGKVELGQGVLTAFAQICADELDIDIASLSVISGDTARVPYQGMTVGSQSMPDASPSIRAAAAEMRSVLLELAAQRLRAPKTRLRVADGVVTDPQTSTSVTYAALVGGRRVERNAVGGVAPKPIAERRYVGTAVPRIDLRGKLKGEAVFIQDVRLDGMVHARVVRPPSYRAVLESVDVAAIEAMRGVLRVHRDGGFLAVLADTEWRAVKAAAALKASARWRETTRLPDDPTAWLMDQPTRETLISEKSGGASERVRSIEATYTRPHLMHGSIGTSCALALNENAELTLYTHSQAPFEIARVVAELVGLPRERVRARFVQNSGCYGQNGADDATAEAALLARAFPGRPVRLVWSRQDEHLWEPYGPAMRANLRASLGDDGKIADWRFDVWSTTHLARPISGAGNLHCAQMIAAALEKPDGVNFGPPGYAADRDAIPGYEFARQRVVTHFVPRQAVHCSSLRSLGAHLNVFATESTMDELARAANADPIAFRMRHLSDPRAHAVIERAAARFGWVGFRRRNGRGKGFAYARYKGLAGFCAICLEVEADRETGAVALKNAVAAVDVGDIVNPDGVVNQTEGAILQALSWTLREEVRVADGRLASRDWRSYPVLTFSDMPAVAVELINRPGEPPLGAGEIAQGPAAAALANAIFDACGARVRDMPLSPEKIIRTLNNA